MLPDLPGIGLWVIETHSYYASLWTAGMVELLESMAKQGRMCEALLKIERQSRKTRHGVRNFAIPVILPQQMTPRQLFAQEMHQALHPGTPLIALPDERQKSLPEHISDLYGDPLPDPLRPDIFDLTAQLEAVVASHHGDLEALYTWAERRFGKPRVQLTTDDLTTLLTLVRNRAKIKTIIEDTPLTESMDPETGELHGDEEPHDDKAQDEATF
jgi:hypothetical protein